MDIYIKQFSCGIRSFEEDLKVPYKCAFISTHKSANIASFSTFSL